MKALLCPNCGSGKFKGLIGNRQCVFCGTEFEVDNGDIEENLNDDIIYCPGPDRFGRSIEIVKVSKPGVSAKEWNSLNHQLGAIEQNWQLARRYCQGNIS